MKRCRIIPLVLAAAVLWGCTAAGDSQQREQPTGTAVLGVPDPSVTTGQGEAATTEPVAAGMTEQTQPQVTEPKATEPKSTEPKATQPKETEPKPTAPKETAPVPNQPKETQPKETEPTVTAPATQPSTEPEPALPTGEFKRQVERYAAQYLNQYRAEAGVQTCQVLPGMTKVAQMRASQLTYNFAHSTADKRAALAYYQYGRWIDASLFGGTPEESYYEADSAEAICAGFRGVEAEAMGKRIADMIRNSSSHWRYIGSSEYSYIAVGVEYRAGTAYGWYGCVMVGKVNYG